MQSPGRLWEHRASSWHRIEVARTPPEDLYREGPNSGEFVRTISRLVAMQTHDYMGEPHIAAELPTPG